jgi:hypothetical protein
VPEISKPREGDMVRRLWVVDIPSVTSQAGFQYPDELPQLLALSDLVVVKRDLASQPAISKLLASCKSLVLRATTTEEASMLTKNSKSIQIF